jgi:hypothetical protein
MKELIDLIVYFKRSPASPSQPIELEIPTPLIVPSPNHSVDYQQGFAAGLKAAKDIERSRVKHFHRIIAGLKREMKIFEEKLDVVDNKFGLPVEGAVVKKSKSVTAGKRDSAKEYEGKTKAVEREFGA